MAAVFHAAHTAAIAAHAVALKEESAATKSPAGDSGVEPLSHLADVTADLAALGALTTADFAAAVLQYSDGFVQAATQDFDRLRRLRLGRYPDAGEAIDPSPEGPLGPL